MKTPEEQIDDLDLEFAAFCGTETGAWASSEIGSDTVRAIWDAALKAQATVHLAEIERTILELKKEAA